MRFLYGVTQEEIIGKDVDIYMDDGTDSNDLIKSCRVFFQQGQLWIDPMPHVKGKKSAMPLPDNAVISRNVLDPMHNVLDPMHGHYAILFTPGTPQWQAALSLIDARKKLSREIENN
jgi:hypothetical protein